MLVSDPGRLVDQVLCAAMWTSLLKQTSWSRLPVLLLPEWTHQDYLQHRVWALNQTRAAQCLFLGNWEPAWWKGSLAIVILYFHNPAPDFSKCALLDVCDSIPSPAVTTANPLPLEMGQNLSLAQAEVNPVSAPPPRVWVCLPVNQSFPKKLNFLSCHRSRARQKWGNNTLISCLDSQPSTRGLTHSSNSRKYTKLTTVCWTAVSTALLQTSLQPAFIGATCSLI